jgi:hypothetical protein
MRDAALGLRAHSGWAALVAVAGDRSSLEVVDRRRVEMTDPRRPLSKQPYHEAEDLPLDKAARLLDRYSRNARDLAGRALKAVAADLRDRGYRLVGSGLLLASGRPLPKLEAILASHALIHTADGEHFRHALMQASQDCGLTVTGVRERELLACAQGVLERPAARLQSTITGLGRGLGPPWTQDQKLAVLVAWVVLSDEARPAGVSRPFDASRPPR